MPKYGSISFAATEGNVSAGGKYWYRFDARALRARDVILRAATFSTRHEDARGRDITRCSLVASRDLVWRVRERRWHQEPYGRRRAGLADIQ